MSPCRLSSHGHRQTSRVRTLESRFARDCIVEHRKLELFTDASTVYYTHKGTRSTMHQSVSQFFARACELDAWTRTRRVPCTTD